MNTKQQVNQLKVGTHPGSYQTISRWSSRTPRKGKSHPTRHRNPKWQQKQEHEKLEKVQRLKEETENIWKIKAWILPLVVTSKISEWLEKISVISDTFLLSNNSSSLHVYMCVCIYMHTYIHICCSYRPQTTTRWITGCFIAAAYSTAAVWEN